MIDNYKDKYHITKHAIQRYQERTNEAKKPTIHRMLRDLHAMRNKKIVNIGDISHIFYKQPNTNVREFIVVRKESKYVVTTIINRRSADSEVAYQNRLRQKKEYEKNKV